METIQNRLTKLILETTVHGRGPECVYLCSSDYKELLEYFKSLSMVNAEGESVACRRYVSEQHPYNAYENIIFMGIPICLDPREKKKIQTKEEK